jgi:hypothetical protein
MHIGRSFDGPGHIEATCPCELTPCGLVDTENVNDECDQHPPVAGRTIRTGHPAENCPGVGRAVVVAMGKTEAARQSVIDAAAMGEPEGTVNLSLFFALDNYRAAVEHEAAERIRALAQRTAKRGSVGFAGLSSAADHIDPEAP